MTGTTYGIVAGYQSGYQALILVLAGVVVYAFLKAHREDTGQVPAPAGDCLAVADARPAEVR